MKPTYFIVFIAMFGVGLASYFFVKSDLFPVLIVDSHFVSTREFNDHVSALSQYYATLIKDKKLSDASITSVDQIRGELRRAALEQFIEDTLIDEGFGKKVGSMEEKKLVDEKLGEINEKIAAPQFSEAVQAQYGLSVDRFKEMALVPQARRELLTAKLADEKKEFGKWRTDARKSASVHILLRGFMWDGEMVKVVMSKW